MTDNLTPLRFLRKVWDAQPDAPTAFISIKNWSTDAWREYPITLPVEPTDLGTKKDLYFAPVLFKHTRRLKQHACGGVWLFADLDEIDPRSLGYLSPHVFWETSPGRYQAMWHLDEPLGPKAWERLNRAVTYRTGADKGGWSLTKVLRVPGTTSTKHGFDFTVNLLHADWTNTVDADTIRTVCREALPPSDPATGRIRLPRTSAREIRRTHWDMLNAKAKKLIRAKTVRPGDDRSAKLWELENLLLDAGMTPGEVVVVVRETVWNKFKGQRREMRMLQQDALRAEQAQRDRKQVPERRQGTFELPPPPQEDGPKPLVGDGAILPFVTLQKFMARTYSGGGWLVDGIWDLSAFGFWAGEFKAYKTWTVLDFAVSVATGSPFLGKFEVYQPGRVLYLHDEGKPRVIHDQLHRILAAKGHAPTFSDGVIEWGTNKELDISSMPMFDLTKDTHRAHLVNYIRTYRPRAVILEAWYLISGGVDENSAQEVSPLTTWLMKLAVEERTAIIVSHHYNKGSGQGVREGNRMSGSGVFSRSFESAVYLERKGEENDFTVQLTSAHRNQVGVKEVLQYAINRDLDEDYNVRFLTGEEAASNDEVLIPQGRVSHAKPNLLPALIAGEVVPLDAAAANADCTVEAMRSRVKKHDDYDLIKSNGTTMVRRVS